MILKIKMQCFRKHIDRTFEFTSGINAIRAGNEQGKSSLLEAIGYALFGAKALKESIDQVVTYDMPASKLKVELDFRHAGIDYRITRGKSGAEITWAGGTVTGQTETAKFIEKLLGANHDMASKLMLAKQKALGGALAGGATAAGKLIEDLADLGLIDQLIASISEKLPSGNVSAQVSMVETLRAQAIEPDLVPLEPLQSAFDSTFAANNEAIRQHSAAKHRYADLDTDAAHAILWRQKTLQGVIELHTGEIATCDEELAVAPPDAPAAHELAAARAAVETEKRYSQIAAVYQRLMATNTDEQWDRPYEELVAEIRKVSAQLDIDREHLATYKAHIATAARNDAKAASDHKLALMGLHGQLIKETTCSLCQKDLTDVPEVVRINSQVQKTIEEIEAIEAKRLMDASFGNVELQRQHDLCKAKVDAGASYLKDLTAVETYNDKVEVVYAAAGDLVVLNRARVPAGWTWIGPEISDVRPAAAGILAGLEYRAQQATAAAAKRQLTAMRLEELEKRLNAAKADLAQLQVDEANDTLEQERILKNEIEGLWTICVQAQNAFNQARQARDMAVAANQAKVDQQLKALASLATAEKALAEMEANNVLVKKLRAARPIITDKLWGIVLAAVTTYFSEVRGERSVLTRVDGEFKVNGRSVDGLSGSAEDVLGLAIRFALTKTFLGVDFVILDEVAAACDDDRELALLGLLAKSGFEQTILVTHSPLAESVADNIITF